MSVCVCVCRKRSECSLSLSNSNSNSNSNMACLSGLRTSQRLQCDCDIRWVLCTLFWLSHEVNQKLLFGWHEDFQVTSPFCSSSQINPTQTCLLCSEWINWLVVMKQLCVWFEFRLFWELNPLWSTSLDASNKHFRVLLLSEPSSSHQVRVWLRFISDDIFD